MQNHKRSEVENAFQIFKVSCLVSVHMDSHHDDRNRMISTTLHVMQTRYSDENAVRLSVRLSVTGVYFDKTEERSV